MLAVVTGMIATYPMGGVAWDYGQYALGLERMGFEVWYLEDTGLDSYDPGRREYGPDCEYGARFTGAALAALSPGLGERWHVRGADDATYGTTGVAAAELVAGADVFLNVSGGCLLRDEYMASRRKVLIDTDPGWNHYVVYPKADAAGDSATGAGFRGHDHFLTYAERLGRPDCPLPALGLDWQPTRPPVVMGEWDGGAAGERWSTVLTWDNYAGTFTGDGVTYGSKATEFPRIEELPRRVDARLEIAAGGAEPPVGRWRELGWSVVDSHSVSSTPDDYRDYVRSSRGEVSPAKSAYVATRSGWFSCRSVCYLAAGRPAVLQDTGFSELVPTGEGLMAFDDVDGAAAGVAAVEADYDRHSAAARALAEREFGHEAVLGDLLERVGLG